MLFEVLAVLEERKIKSFLFSSITAAELQQKLLHILSILAPRTQHRTELLSQSNRCSSDYHLLYMFFDVLQHSVQTATRGAVYSCHFSLESQREHAEEVDAQVKSSGLPCKIGHQSIAILKTFNKNNNNNNKQFI